MSSGQEPAPAWLVACGNFFFRYRNAVFPLVLFVLFAGFRPLYPTGSAYRAHWVATFALALTLIGQALRVAVIGYAYVRRGGKHGRVYAATLVTDGLFAHSRNPLYLGNVLILTGLFMLHNNPWVYLFGFAFFLFAYGALVAAEEAYLRARFGAEYERYCQRVNRWFPDLRGLRRSLAGMRFDWRRVLVKDYGSAYAWLLTVLVLLAYRTWSHGALEHGYLEDLLMLAAVLTVGWILARLVKKWGLASSQHPLVEAAGCTWGAERENRPLPRSDHAGGRDC